MKSKIYKFGHIISVLAGFIFGIVLLQFTGMDDTPVTIALGIIFAFVVDTFIITSAIPENHHSSLEMSNNNQREIQEINKKLNNTESIIKRLVIDRKRIDEIVGHLLGRKDFVRDIGFKVWSDYLNDFQITERGLYLPGEELSLNTAIKFWRTLSIKQAQNKEKPIVVRITHSNDISIWLPDENPISNDLYTFQKQFTQNGGIIVRFLIGHTKKADERYESAMQFMKENGIDVRYFSAEEVGEKDFDFLYLRNESFVLKWYSGAKGGKIAGCFISDKAEEELINRWATLYYRAGIKGEPITSIPPELQFEE